MLFQYTYLSFLGVYRRSFPTKIIAYINRLPPFRYLVSAVARKSFNDRRRVKSAKISNIISFGYRIRAITGSFSSIAIF